MDSMFQVPVMTHLVFMGDTYGFLWISIDFMGNPRIPKSQKITYSQRLDPSKPRYVSLQWVDRSRWFEALVQLPNKLGGFFWAHL